MSERTFALFLLPARGEGAYDAVEGAGHEL